MKGTRGALTFWPLCTPGNNILLEVFHGLIQSLQSRYDCFISCPFQYIIIVKLERFEFGTIVLRTRVFWDVTPFYWLGLQNIWEPLSWHSIISQKAKSSSYKMVPFNTSCWWCHEIFIHSIGMCRMRWFLAVLRSLVHSSLLYTLSFHPFPPTSLPSSLTSSCHLFLGLPLSLVVYITSWKIINTQHRV